MVTAGSGDMGNGRDGVADESRGSSGDGSASRGSTGDGSHGTAPTHSSAGREAVEPAGRVGTALADDPPTPPPTTGLEGRVSSAIRWSAINSLLQRLAAVGISVLLARLIAPEQFGVFAVALVVLNIVLSVSELGVSAALVRHNGPIDEMAPTVTTLSLASGGLLALICVVGAPWFSNAMDAPEAAGVIQLMAVALVIAGATAVPGAMMQRNFRQDHKFYADTAAFVVGTAVAVVLAFMGFGAWSLAWQRIAQNLSAAVIMFWLTKDRFRPGWNSVQAKELLAFGLPLAGSSLLIFGVMNVDYIVVGAMLGTVPLGFYLLAFNLASWPVAAFSAPVRSVSLAAFSKVREDPELFQKAFGRALGLLALVTVPACVLLAALAEPLIRVVYGERWAPAAAALALLVLLGAVRVALELGYDFLASAGRSRAILVIHLVWLGALVPLLALGAHLDGIRGVAAAHVIVAVLIITPAYLVTFKPYGIRAGALGVRLLRPFLGGVLMVAVVLAVRQAVDSQLLQILVGGAASCLAYALVVFPMRHEIIAVLKKRANA